VEYTKKRAGRSLIGNGATHHLLQRSLHSDLVGFPLFAFINGEASILRNKREANRICEQHLFPFCLSVANYFIHTICFKQDAMKP
jgi:hypothetical protein